MRGRRSATGNGVPGRTAWAPLFWLKTYWNISKSGNFL